MIKLWNFKTQNFEQFSVKCNLKNNYAQESISTFPYLSWIKNAEMIITMLRQKEKPEAFRLKNVAVFECGPIFKEV